MPKLLLRSSALVEEVVRDHPAVVSLLRERGVVCIRCGEPVWGTLAELIGAKGLDVEEVLRDLNARLQSAGGSSPSPRPARDTGERHPLLNGIAGPVSWPRRRPHLARASGSPGSPPRRAGRA